MGLHELSNEFLSVTISTFGGELHSVKDVATGREYIWDANPQYWKRHSPVLFPFVGSLKDKEYTHLGKAYPMGQHGFARDMEFEVAYTLENEIWFRLASNEETLKLYPYQFRLGLGYRLEGRKLKVMWKVINTDDETMFFSIGGHPAFMCPLDENGVKQQCYLIFDTKENLVYGKLNDNGLLAETGIELDTHGGELPVDFHMFDEDALIIENDQTHQIALAGPDKKPYVTVKFDSPLVGLWSPAKKDAPFICIEPWFGRCDAANYTGTLSQREWGNSLIPGGEFIKSYTVIFE